MRFDQLGTTAGLIDSVSKKQLSSVNGKFVHDSANNAIVNSPHNSLAVSFAELRSRTKALTATCGLYLSIGGTYEYALAVGSVGTPSHGGMGSHTSLFLMVGCSGSVHARTFTARQEARCEVRLRFVCQPVDTTGARDGSEQQRREIFH